MKRDSSTAIASKLGLGTVQFGLDYGVANSGGKTSRDQVRHILEAASLAGVRIIDTASMYGESEAVLGASWPSEHHFQVVTKTPRLVAADAADLLTRTMFQSLERLKLDAVYGLLVHNAADLLTDNGSLLVETMLRLKEQGVVKKTGVSVYNGQQIDALLKKFTPDLIQLPMNVLDQRLLGSGHLTRLKQLGVEIHVRSAFLQGLLLMEPDSIHPYFEQIRGHLRDYRRFLDEQGLSPIQAALGFVARLEEVDIVLCGVDSLRHFEEIIASPDIGSRADFGRFAINEEAMIDPSQWRLA